MIKTFAYIHLLKEFIFHVRLPRKILEAVLYQDVGIDNEDDPGTEDPNRRKAKGTP